MHEYDEKCTCRAGQGKRESFHHKTASCRIQVSGMKVVPRKRLTRPLLLTWPNSKSRFCSCSHLRFNTSSQPNRPGFPSISSIRLTSPIKAQKHKHHRHLDTTLHYRSHSVHPSSMACPHLSAPGVIQSPPSNLTRPEECSQCFDNQDSPDGIDICLGCYNAGCPRLHAQAHADKFGEGHSAVINVKRVRKPVNAATSAKRVRLVFPSQRNYVYTRLI